jgi:predicted metalloprotease with PDZ domain
MEHKQRMEHKQEKSKRPKIGLEVLEVAEDSYAAEIGIRPQDLIVSVNGEPISGADFLNDWVKKKPVENIELFILRQTRKVIINAPPGPLELKLRITSLSPFRLLLREHPVFQVLLFWLLGTGVLAGGLILLALF